MGAVVSRVGRVDDTGAGHDVEAVHVINDAIAVVIYAGRAVRLGRVGPHVVGEVGMVDIDDLVDDGDVDLVRSRVSGIPRSGSVAAGGVARRGLRAVHPPERAVGDVGVVGHRGGVEDVVGLDGHHSWLVLEVGDRLGHADALAEVHEFDVGTDSLWRAGARSQSITRCLRSHAALLLPRCLGIEGDEHLAWNVRGLVATRRCVRGRSGRLVALHGLRGRQADYQAEHERDDRNNTKKMLSHDPTP